MQTISAPVGFTEAELLDDLNDEQRRAVTHDRGPLLIVAGAGTGKTTVIAKRIAWLIATGRAKPEEILALTFTDKAAGEMIERVDRLLPLGYTDLWISTFHAFCQRLLQTHGLDIGLPDDFRLLNQTDAYLLLRKNFDRFNLDYYRPLGNPTKFLTALLTLFSRAKDEAVHPRDYLEFAKNFSLDKDDSAVDGGEKNRQSELADAYHAYERLLLDHDCIDLGDLMLYALELLAKRPAILEKYRRQFKYVLVDEFQDTNWAQYELVKRLVPAGGNVAVVGDDDQSIYKFRGASVSNILQFKNDFTAAGEIVLTKNYRSLQNILDLTYGFIQRNNPNRLEAKLNAGRPEGSQLLTKKLAAERPGAAVISHLHFSTLEDEVAGVVDKIVAIKDEKGEADWSDFAILVRSNANADDFSRELHRRSIPYQFLGLKGLYAKPIVMDCIAYFKLLDNYHESQALYRVLCSPAYRIAVEDLVRLTHESAKKAASLYEIAKNHRLIADLQEATRTTLDRLLGHVAVHSALARERSVAELLVKFLYDSGTIEHIKGDTVEDRDRASHLKQFLSRLKRFELGHDDPTLTHFMEEFELERESGDEGSLAFDPETGPDMVKIMTVHSAKGLEFPYVFIVNMVDKKFPSVARGSGIELPEALTKEIVPEGDIHLEEERRLFYVAMTRARDGLFFSSAEDYGGKTKKKLSRFLAELGFSQPALTPSAVELSIEAPAAAPETRAPSYAPPPHFSFTQLAAYQKCPLQYKFAHVIKIPVFGKPQLSFGKTMHGTLEKFLREAAARRGTAQPSLFGASSAPESGPAKPAATMAVTKDELFAMYDEAWQDDWYPDKPTKEKYREKGRAILSRFYDSVAAAPPDPLFLEKDFTLKVGAYAIKGRIDRVDRAAGGKVEIIDYKTGAPKTDETLKSDDKKQLLLYQIVAERVLGLKLEKLTYHYLEDGSTVSFLGVEKELGKVEAEVEETIAAIKKGDFTAKPGMHCGFCDFASICEARAS